MPGEFDAPSDQTRVIGAVVGAVGVLIGVLVGVATLTSGYVRRDVHDAELSALRSTVLDYHIRNDRRLDELEHTVYQIRETQLRVLNKLNMDIRELR